MNKVAIGKRWEDRVACYLIENGYSILERNYRFHSKEVDIIASKDDLVVFVEVKYRAGRTFGAGVDSVTTKKKQNILSVAMQYMGKKRLYNRNVRFDVADIEDNKLSYIEDAFRLESVPLWRN
jgi:putative endonuclease